MRLIGKYDVIHAWPYKDISKSQYPFNTNQNLRLWFIHDVGRANLFIYLFIYLFIIESCMHEAQTKHRLEHGATQCTNKQINKMKWILS